MITHTWEDWALGVSLVLALAFGAALYTARTMSFAGDAVAAETPDADYVMTVTAHRLPRECKGVAEQKMSAMCRAALNDTTVSVHANN